MAAWKFALFAGLAFTVPYTLTAIALGPEFPTLIGGLVGLAVVVPVAQRGWLIPTDPWDFPPRDQWDDSWQGHHTPVLATTRPTMSTALAWMPYALVAVLLVISRVVVPVQTTLRSLQVSWPNIFETTLTTFYYIGFAGVLGIVLLHGGG